MRGLERAAYEQQTTKAKDFGVSKCALCAHGDNAGPGSCPPHQSGSLSLSDLKAGLPCHRIRSAEHRGWSLSVAVVEVRPADSHREYPDAIASTGSRLAVRNCPNPTGRIRRREPTARLAFSRADVQVDRNLSRAR
jgi:hypothetical protein